MIKPGDIVLVNQQRNWIQTDPEAIVVNSFKIFEILVCLRVSSYHAHGYDTQALCLVAWHTKHYGEMYYSGYTHRIIPVFLNFSKDMKKISNNSFIFT